MAAALYADRQGPPSREPAAAHRVHSRPGPHTRDARVCWIGSPGRASAREIWRNHGFRIAPRGVGRNLAIALSLKPDTLARGATVEFAHLVDMGGSGLGDRGEAIIGVVVAGGAGETIVSRSAHHAQRGLGLDGGATLAELGALADNPAGDSLNGREREVARLAEAHARAGFDGAGGRRSAARGRLRQSRNRVDRCRSDGIRELQRTVWRPPWACGR